MEHLAGHIRAQQTQPKRAAAWYRKAFAAGNSNFGSSGVHASARRVARPRCAGHGQPVVTRSGFGGLVGGYDATGASWLRAARGTPLDYAKALSWFLRASALGDANADVGLGYLVDAELVDDSELQPAESIGIAAPRLPIVLRVSCDGRGGCWPTARFVKQRHGLRLRLIRITPKGTTIWRGC